MPRRLSNWLESYLEYTDNSEPTKMFHTWSAISTVAAVLQRKCVVNWGPLRFYPNMYIVLVGPPGKARKGTAMSYSKDFLVRAGVHMAAESITREALVREIAEAQETVIDEHDPLNITLHSSLTVFAPELVVFLGYNQQQLMMDLTDWFDCGHGPEGKWTYRTKNMGVDEITGIWVNLFGATTPDLLRSTLSLDAIGGGLTSRIIFVYAPDKGKSCPAPFMSPATVALGEDLYYDLEKIQLIRGQFKPDNEFIEHWVDWYVKEDQKDIFQNTPLAPYVERRPLHIMKLAMIISAMYSSDMIITSKHLTEAIALLELTERDMPKVFSGVGKSPHAEVLSKVMNEIGMRGEITKSELMAMFYNDADDRVMEIIIETLRSMKFLVRVETERDTILRHKNFKKEESS